MSLRYTVEIPSKLAKVFKDVAVAEEISQSELMRKALLTYAVLHEEVKRGRDISILTHSGGPIEKNLVLCL